MKIVENMQWPPMGPIGWKMAEHSAWYSGDADILANFYTDYARNNIFNLTYQSQDESFWGRNIKNQGEIKVHVPIAGDIAETSANFLFGESPIIKIDEAHGETAAQSHKDTQSDVDDMLLESGFFRKILEAAETSAGIGGVYIKIAWDEELSPYPIPVIVQGDKGIPEFKFGIMVAVTFWSVVDIDSSGNKVYRMLERYEKGYIRTTLWRGSADKLGYEVELTALNATKDVEPVIKTVDELLAFYIPNKLPNRIDRTSYMGRSDYSGIEGLMDSLDETYSSWVKDIVLGHGRIHVPESYLTSKGGKGPRFNLDKSVYVELDIDPTSLAAGSQITATQFAIRANEFEKTSLNLLDRIFSSAGYSPQSFGLNIAGRAESGTALALRERKSFATKSKKENYWQDGLKKIIRAMMLVYNEELSGQLEPDVTVNVSFTDGLANNITELATSLKMISDAQAASTETKVRLLHPDWEEESIIKETQRIIDENGLTPMSNPDTNPDTTEIIAGQ